MNKILRKSMIIFALLVGVYFVAGSNASAAGSSCYQGCNVSLGMCLSDYSCYDNPDNLGCNFCETRFNSCVNYCQRGNGGGGQQPR